MFVISFLELSFNLIWADLSETKISNNLAVVRVYKFLEFTSACVSRNQ